MLNKFKTFTQQIKTKFSFSYYKKGDISMDLLLTLSMQQSDKKYKNHKELVESLISKNLLKTETIVDSMLALDRQFFFQNVGNNPEGYYSDKPYDIGHGEKISAPIMHAITAEYMYNPIQNMLNEGKVNIIDVGTGSGYIATLFYHIFAKELRHANDPILYINGLDLYDTFMRNTNLVLASLLDSKVLFVNKAIDIQFKKRDFFEYLTSKVLESEENIAINLGAAIDKPTYEKMKAQINHNGTIMSPVIQPDGEQNLMFFSKIGKNIKENPIMKVIYAPMKPFVQAQNANEEINKYFISNPKDVDNEEMSFKAPQNLGILEEQTDSQKLSQLEHEVKLLEEKVKKWHEDFSRSGRKVSLLEMQNSSEMKDILQILNKKKRHMNILKRTIHKN